MTASAQALIERAERCLDTFDLPLALKFYERALTLAPDDVATLDAAGELLMRLGDADRAIELLQRSVALRAEGSFATHMNLGQLLGGAEALAHFETGLRLLRKREAPLRKRSAKGVAGAEAREELDVVEGHICAALCAIAEVHLTDLCDEPDAEAACERAVQAALEVGKGNGRAPLAEALQASANLRISQCRPADAASALRSVVQQIATAVDAGSLEALPSHEFRTTTAKLCLEVGEDEGALEVLEQLLLEDEDSAELRYLAALAAARAGDAELAAGHVDWFDAQLQKPGGCDDSTRQWSSSFEQARAELAALEELEHSAAPAADAEMDTSQ